MTGADLNRDLRGKTFAEEYRQPPFTPPWWLSGPNAQTMGGKLFRRDPDLSLQRSRIDTPDGDFLDLDFTPDPDPSRPLILVLHGLEGSSRRAYMLTAYAAMLAHGMAAVGLNFRSCSGEPNRTARLYHSGETEDMGFVLETLSERFPGRPLGALGFSLGGNVLLKSLGESGEDAPTALQAAAAISVPYDLAAGADTMEAGAWGRLYTAYFLRMLKKKIRAKAGILKAHLDTEGVLRTRTIREFDDLSTAPLHGFANAEEYYRLSSSNRFLSSVRVPTLLVHAMDDPFLPREAIPANAIDANPALHRAFMERGGHVAFMHGGTPWSASPWAEEEAARFLVKWLVPDSTA